MSGRLGFILAYDETAIFPAGQVCFSSFFLCFVRGVGQGGSQLFAKVGRQGGRLYSSLSLSLSLYLSGYDSMLYRWPVFFFPPLFVDWRLVGLDGDVRRLN